MNIDKSTLVVIGTALIVAVAGYAGIQIYEAEAGEIVTGCIAIVTAVLAVWERNKKKEQEKKTDALAYPDMAPQAVVETIPGRAWKMNEATKKFLCSGEFEQYSESIRAQIDIAEAENRVRYVINVPNGIQYVISYGLLEQQIGNT